MKSNRSAFLPLSLFAALFLGACTTVVRDPGPAPRVLYRDMPPPVSEVRPPPPVAGYNWVPGHYVWRQTGWTWLPGYYVQAQVRPMPPVIVEPVPAQPQHGRVYVRGHWQWGGSDWVWVRGHWVEN